MVIFKFVPIILLVLLQLLQTSRSHARNYERNHKLKTEVFLSPEIVLEPGLVSDKFYYNVDFPRGHIALKSFDAEVVDERGNPIPLHETYLHHWVIQRYYRRKYVDNDFDRIVVENSGLCDDGLTQYFGLGSETRKTDTYVPDPYGIEVGNTESIPEGYEEAWWLNVHAIDTRGVVDKLSCAECRCDLYNITIDKYGQALPENYKGGLRCCHDETRCKLQVNEEGVIRGVDQRRSVGKY